MADNGKILEALKMVAYPGFDRDIVSLDAVTTISDGSRGETIIDLKQISADPAVLTDLEGRITSALQDIGIVAVTVLVAGKPIEAGGGGSCSHGGSDGPGEDPFKRKKLPGVAAIIPVVSGKGGVGKSTVAVNLAHTLQQKGNRVGLLDLDLFGPSVHRMLGTIGQALAMEEDLILPHEKWGLKIVSLGMALKEDDALILRGPMVMKLLNQLLGQVKWGELDYLVVDMPPGTGDIPLSLVQQLHIDGAVIVTTPQDISLIDVRRAAAMFAQTKTPILGVVENMSYYKCEKCGDIAHLFGEGGGKDEAARIGAPLLGQVPLVKSICEEGDKGEPIVDAGKSPAVAEIFSRIADNVISGIEKKVQPA